MIGIKIHKVILALLLCAASAGAAEFKVANLFQDHMVLQRDKPIKIWGWTDVGGRVSVAFAGQTKTVEAGKDGKWMVTLDPIPASSAGRTMTLASSADRQTVEIKDVLVGEVWVCSGQSNMSYTMSRFGNCAAEVPQMNYPLIRHFTVFGASHATPRKDVFGAWAVCSPQTARRFSATALYYAVELYKTLNVPIGLINSSAGGTNAQQWSDLPTLEANPVNESVLLSRKEKVAAVEAASALAPDVIPTYEKALWEYLSVVGVNVALVNEQRERAFMNPDLSDAHWREATLPASTGNGVAWFAREVRLTEAMTGKELTLNVEPARRERTTYWNGVKLGPDRSHTIPASLAKATNSLAVRVAGIRGGGMSGAPSITGANGQTLSLGENWKLHVYAKEPSLPKELSARGAAAGLYNGMIHPLIPYTIRGVIWYQGENGPEGYTYRIVFPDMIRGWRKNWGQGDFPFYFCQLANYHPKQHAVAERHGWPLIREAQSMALELPNTGMACLIDVGKLGTYERDIHPANNQDQGKRLALIARDKIYGEDIVSSGPTYESMTIKGNKIVVKFKSVGSGLLRAGIKGWYDHTIIPLPTHPGGLAIHGFTIAGADGDFRMAHARIVGEDTVEVWHPKVPEPKYVRFAWHANPLHNLYNKEKLPAVPFRTDQLDLLKKSQ
jgi:sialate O-acetylesterase